MAVIVIAVSLLYLHFLHILHTLKAVEVPVYYDPGAEKYFVQVQIGTKKGWMLLDTGCQVTLLDRITVESENIKTLGSSKKIVFGFTNEIINTERARVRSIRIADWEIRNPVVNVANSLPVFTKQVEPVFGYLGYDLIRKWPFVRISKDRLVFSIHPPALHAQARAFPLRTYTGHPSVFLPNTEGDTVYLIDTGSISHFISIKSKDSATKPKLLSENSSLISLRNLLSATFAPVLLQSIEDVPLWFPAIVKQEQEPPFSAFPPQVKGIIGSGILQRYEIVLDHRNLRVYFLPFSQANQKGTYGFIPYEWSSGRLSGYFIVSPVSGDLVYVLSMNDKEIDCSNKENLYQILQPSIGTLAKFTVATKSGKVRQFTCEAFAPEEIGLQIQYEYDNRNRLKNFRFHFSYQ